MGQDQEVGFCRFSIGQKKGRCRKGYIFSDLIWALNSILGGEPKQGSGDSEVYRMHLL